MRSSHTVDANRFGLPYSRVPSMRHSSEVWGLLDEGGDEAEDESPLRVEAHGREEGHQVHEFCNGDVA
jgi:hypothetical protein